MRLDDTNKLITDDKNYQQMPQMNNYLYIKILFEFVRTNHNIILFCKYHQTNNNNSSSFTCVCQ